MPYQFLDTLSGLASRLDWRDWLMLGGQHIPVGLSLSDRVAIAALARSTFGWYASAGPMFYCRGFTHPGRTVLRSFPT